MAVTASDRTEPFIDSTALLDDTPALRRRLAEHGYLFLRGVAPRERILDVRRQACEILAEAGWLDPSVPAIEARWSGLGPYTEGEPEYMAVYKRVLQLPAFNELPRDPIYIGFLERLLEGPIFNHRMHIGRISFPNNVRQTTPAHQDFFYISGAPETYTIWTPLGDLPRKVGGLAVLAGSNHHGFHEHAAFPEQKYAGRGFDDAMIAERFPGCVWHTGDFLAGDLLLFHSYTVHRGTPNLSGNTLRLSSDNRYQREGTETARNAHRTHHDLV